MTEKIKKKGGLPDAIPPIPKEKDSIEEMGYSPIGSDIDKNGSPMPEPFKEIDPIEKLGIEIGGKGVKVELTRAVIKVTGLSTKSAAEKLKGVDFCGLKFHSPGAPGEYHFRR